MNLRFKILNLKFDRKIILFLAVFVLGVFLRVWKFSDWLYFKRDEARDAFEIWQAYTRGPGWLPLLGPDMTVKQGARFFVGPIYYYFQYLAALIFHSAQPAVLAYPDLFFGILTVPLLYLFLRKFFSRNWSMFLAGFFAVDFLAIQYSRFAWNPNSLPFFNLLFFYAFLNVFDSREKRPILWAAIAGFAFAVSTQLHVIAMVALPAIALVSLLFRFRETKKYLNWKKIVAFLAAAAFVYIPVIIHEIVKNGRNFKVLFRSADSGQYYSSFAANILTVVLEVGKNWFLILTGHISGDADKWTAIVAWLVFVLPALWLAYKIFRKEKDEGRKNFVALVVLWLAGYLAVYVPVAMHMQVRFVLPILVLPVVFAGMILEYLWSKNHAAFKIVVGVLVAAAVLGNLAGTFLWFREVRAAQLTHALKPKRTLILKKQDGVVLWHLEQAAEYMKNDCGSDVIYLSTEREYITPIRYVLKMRGAEAYPLEAFSATGGGSKCIYNFEPVRSGKKLTESLAKDFDILEQKNFGVLRVVKLGFKDSAEPARFDTPFVERKRCLLWRDLFSGKESKNVVD